MKSFSVILLIAFATFATLVQAKDFVCNPGECDPHGLCKDDGVKRTCECDPGWMGERCQRPCQDVYKSCDRWYKERRCIWARRLYSFYDDNCAESCNICEPQEGNKLDIPLAPILEPAAWLVGKWEATTENGDRFPMPMLGPYTETLDFQLAEVSMFDRPSLNYTAIAISRDDPDDMFVDLGFITTKFFAENTGFVDPTKNEEGLDEISLELNSNSGINTIEEGVMRGTHITFNATFVKAYPHVEYKTFELAMRTFQLNKFGQLEESVTIKMPGNDEEIKWTKAFNRLSNRFAV